MRYQEARQQFLLGRYLEYYWVMQAKLTLELEQTLIERAERYAEASGKSVSQVVADYFAQLDEAFGETLPPITRSLSGVLAGTEADKTDYYRHLEKKYA